MVTMCRPPTYLVTIGGVDRHDQVKLLLYRLCLWAGLPVEMEVFNIFSRHIPQQGLATIDRDRQRQAMVPDLKIAMTMEGTVRPVLHEIKVISCSKTRYKPSWTDRAVDKRAAALHQEYVDKAKAADQLYSGVDPTAVGPVESKLVSFGQVKGVVFGNFGEVSEATHKLLEAIATSRAGSQKGRKGYLRSEEGEKSVVVGQIRKMGRL